MLLAAAAWHRLRTGLDLLKAFTTSRSCLKQIWWVLDHGGFSHICAFGDTDDNELNVLLRLAV